MKNLKANDGRATGAVLNTILIIPSLVCTGYHFYELSKVSACSGRSAAIIGEVGNLTAYIARVSYCLAVNNVGNKEIDIGIMAVSLVAKGGLQVAEGIVAY